MSALLLVARGAGAQTRLQQDALDNLQARSNVVQGAGARAFGMGGAFLARPDDATAASWNPAGLSYLRSPEVSLVGTHTTLAILQKDSDANTTRDDRQSGRAPDFLAGTYPFAIGSLDGAAQLSFQRVISFDGRRTIERPASVRQFEALGGFDVIAFGTGLQLSRTLRAGFAFNRWLNGYSYTSERVGRAPTRQTLDLNFSGWNVNLGLIWSPIEQLNLGAVYKTGFTADVDLSRGRTDFGAVVTSNQFRSSAVRLGFPAAFGLGTSWRPSAPLTLSADYTRTDWSNGRIYDYFTLPPSGAPTAPDDRFDALLYPTLVPGLTQVDTQQLRVGVEFVVIKSRVKWPLRLGYFADRQLFQTFNSRTALRDQTPLYNGFTAGTGLIIGRVLIDVAYVFEGGSYRDADPEADDPSPSNNTVRSHRVFVSLIYRHKH